LTFSRFLGGFVVRLFDRIFIICIFIFLPSLSQASTLVLDSGEKIQGVIIERTPLRIMVDIKGDVETFYLGEILSIDGQKVITPIQHLTIAKEEASMAHAIAQKKEAALKPAPVAAPVPKPVVNTSLKDAHVVPTPDGGIIVVSATKITKYDKDLKMVKEINTNS